MFHLYVINGCPYCENAINLVKDNKLSADITVVKPEEKHHYKLKHELSTFPHVFYKNNKNSRTMKLIGGSTDFKHLINSLHTIKDINLPNTAITNILNEL